MLSGCGNTTFVSEDSSDGMTIVEGLEERLVDAANRARENLISSPDIHPAIEIINENGATIVVEDLIDSTDYREYFLVYKNTFSSSSPIIKIPKDRYRYVYFKGLRDCRIFIKCKLLKLMFHDCSQCQISLTSPVIGMVEFFKCSHTNANFRVAGEGGSSLPFPITRIEECQKFNLFQSNDELFYLVKKSVDINGTIIHPLTKERQATYQLCPTSLQLNWAGPQQQTFIRLSRDEGFASAAFDYALNDVNHNFIMRGIEDTDTIMEEEMIIGTPPI